MPNYQYRCEQCGTRFEARMSMVEHDQNRPECPQCHSDQRVRGELATFAVKTDKKS